MLDDGRRAACGPGSVAAGPTRRPVLAGPAPRGEILSRGPRPRTIVASAEWSRSRRPIRCRIRHETRHRTRGISGTVVASPTAVFQARFGGGVAYGRAAVSLDSSGPAGVVVGPRRGGPGRAIVGVIVATGSPSSRRSRTRRAPAGLGVRPISRVVDLDTEFILGVAVDRSSREIARCGGPGGSSPGGDGPGSADDPIRLWSPAGRSRESGR